MCPECGAPMVAYEFEGVEIDRCLKCGGTWLDGGELEQICRMAEVATGPLTDAIEQAAGTKNRDRRCPRCAKAMETISVDPKRPVQLERCPFGDGLWLDRGEMRRLIDATDDSAAGAVARFFADLYQCDPQTPKNPNERKLT